MCALLAVLLCVYLVVVMFITKKELKKEADRILREDGYRNKTQKSKWVKKKTRKRKQSANGELGSKRSDPPHQK